MIFETKFFFWLRVLGKWLFRILASIVGLVILAVLLLSASSLIREAKTPQEAAPSNGRYISAGDINVFVQEQGPTTGHPVLLIHGFGAWSETWKQTMDALAEQGFHVYALDMPPFGFSEKVTSGDFSRQSQSRRILATLDTLDIEQVTLVGHSVGARPTIETALVAPHRVHGLVLVDPALGFGDNGQFVQNDPSLLMKAFFSIRSVRNALLASTVTNPLMTKLLLSTFVADSQVLTQELLRVYQKPFVVQDSTNRLGDWLKVLSLDADESLSADFANFAHLAMPTLIVWGDKDTVTPLDQGQQLKQLIPSSQLVVLPNVGHIPQIEDPVAFNTQLIKFLDTLTP